MPRYAIEMEQDTASRRGRYGRVHVDTCRNLIDPEPVGEDWREGVAYLGSDWEYEVQGGLVNLAPCARKAEEVLNVETRVAPEESAVIRSLQRLARRWPRSLTLASMGGSLVVVHTDDGRFDSSSSLDRQAAIIAEISGIPNTGGDW